MCNSIIILIIGIIGGFFLVRLILNEINGESKYLLLELNGEKEVILKYNDEYTDLGAKASYKDNDLTDKIEIDNKREVNIFSNDSRKLRN